MRRAALLVIAALLARGETRRALVVGIDQYTHPLAVPTYQPSLLTLERRKAVHGEMARPFIDSLQGAYNDARAMKEMLVARLGFEEKNVILLPNRDQAASADNILGLLQTFLIDSAQPGDVSLFYYAGHGSRIRNTAEGNANASGFDSTIIPQDALFGVPDIRSKELARIYARAPKKHVALTVILDSCFSGAASRGAVARHRVRAQPANGDVWVNETLDVPLPEDSGVLVLAASQDYEPAAELEQTDLDGPHGAFTWALLHVLGSSAPDERVDHIFQRTRALMQAQSPGQEPVMLAKNGLNARGLFEQPAGKDSRLTVAAGRVNGSHVRLSGGLASGLHEGCELKRVHPSEPAATVRITRVTGLAASEAEVIDGQRVNPGDLFELEKWMAPDTPALRLYAGAAGPEDEIRRGTALAAELKSRAPARFVDDPSERTPTHVISWNGANWTIRKNVAGAKAQVIKRVDAGAMLRMVPKDGRVAVLIPAPRSLGQVPRAANVEITDSLARADYVLLGRACGTDCVEYAWALPDVTAEDLGAAQSARPVRSDWIRWNGETTALQEAAMTLARVAGWMELANSAARSPWPYRLALERVNTQALIDSGVVREGEEYRLVLRAETPELRVVAPRWVYVFVVDSWGQSKLLCGESNLGNQFPSVVSVDAPERIELPEPRSFTIGEPYGADHYYLLTTATPIDSPETVLQFDGVRTRGAERLPDDPLARLLRMTAVGTRGAVGGAPVNWSIEEITIVSRGK